jgi:sugar/nucleoside kinase (ribokinase family)
MMKISMRDRSKIHVSSFPISGYLFHDRCAMRDMSEEIIERVRSDRLSEPALTVIGDLNFDYIYTAPPLMPGKEVLISSFRKCLAGAAGVFSCGLAKLGARVYFLTAVGKDKEGKNLLHEMRRRGVVCKCRRFVRVEKGTHDFLPLPELLGGRGFSFRMGGRGAFTLVFTQEGEELPRQVATYPGPLLQLSITDFNCMKYVMKSSALYSCNYFVIPRLREEIGGLFAQARERGVLTAYDANAGDGWENKRSLQSLIHSIYPSTDVVFLNDQESFYLTGEKNTLRSIGMLCPNAAVVVIKRGSRGVLLRNGDRTMAFEPFPLDSAPKDTVGAGDSFQAGFLYFHLKGFSLLHSVILGAANATSTLQYAGGTGGQLDKGGLVSLLSGYRVLYRDEAHVAISQKKS